MNIQDRRKTLTVEELRRRYNLDALDKDRKAIKLQKEQLTKVDAELNDFVEITTKNLKELQNQVDGNITTWFFNGVPRVENEPSSNWTTEEEKINHLGDLYYDQDTGYAYRWAYENNIYVWSKIVDADVVEALAVANAAQDTADSKRRVFVVQPKPPYDIGDIWIKEDTDLYRCRASRSEGNFNIADWTKATNYTDDTVALGTKAELDQFKTQVTENYVSNATLETTVNSITGKVEETYTYITTVENQVNDITTTTQTSTGDNNLYITDALESNALEYHIDGKSEQKTILPDGYTQVDYLESNGTQYIDTGFSPNQDTRLQAKVYATDKNTYFNVPFGSRDSNSTTQYFVGMQTDQANGTWFFRYKNNSYISTFGLKHGENIIDMNKNVYTVNNESFSFTYSTFTSTNNIHLFALNTNGSISNQFYGKIYYCKIYDNGTLVRDYIPCINSDNVLGLYDLVNNTFYTNNGTGTFTYGNVASLPSPDYPSEIKTVKGIENLFNKDDVFFNKQWNGNSLVESEVANASPKIPVIGGKKYKRNVGYNANIFIKNDGSVVDIQGGTNTIVAPENSKYWVFNIPKEVDVNTIIAVQGDTISDYVPYGAWAKVKVNGKNILKIKDFTLTQNGITLKCENGVFKVSGTSTGMPTFFITNYVNINELNSMLSGKTLTISSSIPLTNKPNFNIGATGNFYWAQVNNGNSYCTRNLDSNTKISTVYLYFGGASGTVYNEEFTIQIGQGTATKYEEYKENEVLIDLNKPNLFDKNNVKRQGYYDGTVGATASRVDSTTRLLSEDINVSSNTSYSFELGTTKTLRYNIFESDENNVILKVTATTTNANTTITTLSNTKKVSIMLLWQATSNTITLDDISDCNIKLYEGINADPYYELSSIGDTKDTLSITNEQVIIDMKIGKAILNGSENWYFDNSNTNQTTLSLPMSNIASSIYYSDKFKCNRPSSENPNRIVISNKVIYMALVNSITGITDTDSNSTKLSKIKTWLSNNPVSLYYELVEPQQIVLPNVNIPLFNGVNHITLVDDLETTTSIKFLRQTPISGEYATNQQLGETNYNLANTTSKTNENTLNLNATNTNLNNNYYTKPQIDIMNTATTEEITTIKKEVETKITAEDLTIAINQIKTTGATSVETTTGYKFNEEGLSIQKSGSEMSSLLDNDGLVVKRNDTEMLTVRSSGVEAENITVRTYFTIGNNTRAENYKGGTGFFYIGGDD